MMLNLIIFLARVIMISLQVARKIAINLCFIKLKTDLLFDNTT